MRVPNPGYLSPASHHSQRGFDVVLKFLKRFLAILVGVFFRAGTLDALEGLQVGMKAPIFKLKDLSGKEFALADLRDSQTAVVIFWANWSDHSAAVLERVERLYRKYKKEKLGVLAVNVEKQQLTPEDLSEIKKSVARLGVTFPVLIDEGLRVFREYGVVAVPSTVVLDKEGVIRGEMAAFPLALREDLFDLMEALAEGREIRKQEEKSGYQPAPRAVRYYNLARAMTGRGIIDEADENLKKVFGGKAQVSMFEMTALVSKHLS